jgi:uncharacterized membrane protein YkvA (DUF1232 family)
LALLWPVVRRLPAYARLAWALAREPSIPARHKALLYAAAVYTVTPAHAPLGVIPVVGQVDSPVLLLLGLRTALAHCPASVARRHLAAAGLSRRQLEVDLGTTLYVAGVALGQASRSTARQLRFAARVARGFTRRTIQRLAGDPPSPGEPPGLNPGATGGER